LKKSYTILQVIAILTVSALIIAGFSGFEEYKDYDYQNVQFRNEVSKLISEKHQNTIFEDVNLFTLKKDINIENDLNSFVSNHILLSINKENLNQVLHSRKENINLRIPVTENNFVEIEMTRVSIRTEDFVLKSLSGNKGKHINIDKGLHYRGMVKGNTDSWAAFSFFENNVMGMVASEGGNYVLGAIQDDNKNFTSNYVFYNDGDLLKGKEFICGVNEKEDLFVRNYKNPSNTPNSNTDGNRSLDTVGIYFETDYQMYDDFGGNVNNLVNYVYGVFNQVATMYQNESIPIQISGIGYWQNPDPYINDTDSYDILTKFGYNTQDDFNGDLAHLISTGHNQVLGGIAWINVLCTPYNTQDYSGRYAFSNIENSYNPYPIYSWTVMVITHEMGHNFGSYHTHACHWPNGAGIGPIDTCVVTAENSSSFYGCVPIYPHNGCERSRMGTVMSYCHFCINYGGGISMVGGFGPMPGDTVRRWYNLANCLHYETNSSEIPVAFRLLQNYPNPFNPTTNIKYALPEEGFVSLVLYDITGREVARLVDNKFFNAGIYSHIVDANLYNMSSGVYIYKINVTGDNKSIYSEIRKMVLIK